MVARAGRAWTPLGQNLAGCRAAARGDPSSGTQGARYVQRRPGAVRTDRLPTRSVGAQADFRPGRAAATLRALAASVTPLFLAAAQLQALCEPHQWRFCFIGGLAVLRWGEPRETVGVDLTLVTGFAGERQFISTLMAAFAPRIPDAAAFAEANRVLLHRGFNRRWDQPVISCLADSPSTRQRLGSGPCARPCR